MIKTSTSKICETCGVPIYFRHNSKNEWVPFNCKDNICHYSEGPYQCTMPKKKNLLTIIQKPNTSFKAAKGCKPLNHFFGVGM